MSITIIYRNDSEVYRPVQEFIELLNRKYPGRDVQEVELDTREGAELASIYQIDTYPGIIVKSDDMSVMGVWKGLPMPLVDEVVSSTIA